MAKQQRPPLIAGAFVVVFFYYYLSNLAKRDFLFAALFFLMTPFFAALSIALNAEDSILLAASLSFFTVFSIFLITSFIAFLRWSFMAFLRKDWRIAFLADFVIGICILYQKMLYKSTLQNSSQAHFLESLAQADWAEQFAGVATPDRLLYKK